jgi:urease accessory protein
MTTESRHLQLLLAWMSPAFPIGAFAYSHGLEFAIEDTQVTDAESLRQWIEDVLARGTSWNDAVIFARCWDVDAAALNELALALAGSRERYLETTSLGNAFMQAAAIWLKGADEDQPNLVFPAKAGTRGCRAPWFSWAPVFAGESMRGNPVQATLHHIGHADAAYPVAAGTFCRAANIERAAALLAYLQGFASALISVAVRLIPLGQTQGLAVLRDLMPVIAATAARAASATLDDLGSSTVGADIAAMKHETQYSRMFRT